MFSLKGTTGWGQEKRDTAAFLLIAAIISISYLQAISYGFITDDFGLVVNNPNIKSWSSIGHIFSSGYWDSAGCTRGLYRPLAILSFLVEYSIFGLNPAVYHLDNIVLHLAASVLCYLLLKEVFKDSLVPLYSALLFAAHPVHTEAVTWVSGRAELLAAVLSLISMYIFIKRRGNIFFLFLSLLTFFLALLTKESSATVPLLLTLYLLIIEQKRKWTGYIGTVMPYFAVLAVFLVLKYRVIGTLGPQRWDQAFWGMPLGQRFLTMCVALYEYIRLGFLPFDLKADYIFPPPDSFMHPKVIFIFMIVVLLAVFARRLAQASRPALFAALWFFAALAPVSNIIPAGIIMSERAMYMPSLGSCILLGMLVSGTAGTITSKRLPAYYQHLLVAAMLILFVVSTTSRNGVWHNQESFITTYLSMLQNGEKEHPGHAPLYKEEARIRTRYLDSGPETMRAVRQAIMRSGPDFELHAMLSGLYSQKGMDEAALSEIREAIRLYPQSYYFDYEGDHPVAAGKVVRSLAISRYRYQAERARSAVPHRQERDTFKFRAERGGP